jgi:membrane protease YdiL (CAAX protease family)
MILISGSERRPWTPVGALIDCGLIYFIASFLASFIATWIPSEVLAALFDRPDDEDSQWARYVIVWTIWLATILWMLLADAVSRQVVTEIVRFPSFKTLSRKIKAHTFLLFFAILSIDSIAAYLFPEEFSYDNEWWHFLLTSKFKFIVLFNTLLLGPVLEEIVYRGLLFPTLANSKLGLLGSAVFTSILWSVSHFYTWPATLCIFLSGLAMCYMRHISGSLWPSLLVHIALNFFTCMQIMVSGPISTV